MQTATDLPSFTLLFIDIYEITEITAECYGSRCNPNSLVVFGLPFPQTTSDHPETSPLLIYAIDTKFQQKSFS